MPGVCRSHGARVLALAYLLLGATCAWSTPEPRANDYEVAVLAQTLHSPLGRHLRCCVLLDGKPVVGSQVLVSALDSGETILKGPGARMLAELGAGRTPPLEDPLAVSAFGDSVLYPSIHQAASSGEPVLCYLPRDGGFLPAQARLEDPGGPRERLLIEEAASGRVIQVVPLAKGFAGTTLVFDPNPVVVAGGRVPQMLELDRLRSLRDLRLLDGSGLLRGKWADVLSPGGRAFSAELRFEYASSDPHFEEAMAYYHVTQALRHLAALGFSVPALVHQRVSVHATALDRSWYSPSTRTIYFGDGGHQDAEDADVILHELGHAVYDALVGTATTAEASAVEEGFADFFAAANTGDPRIGEWDAAVFGAPCLRDISERFVYPFDVCGNPHDDGRILSGALWDLATLVGPDASLTLALEALLLAGPEAGFQAFARSLLKAAASESGLGRRDVLLDAAQEALGRHGLWHTEGSAELREGDPPLTLPLPPLGHEEGAGFSEAPESLAVLPEGWLELRGHGRRLLLAAVAVEAPSDRGWYQVQRITWSARSGAYEIEQSFESSGRVQRRARTVLGGRSSLRIQWLADGEATGTPFVSGVFPEGRFECTHSFDPRTEDSIRVRPDQSVCVQQGPGTFRLSLGLVAIEITTEALLMKVLERPFSRPPNIRAGLRVIPEPAHPRCRLLFRAPTPGLYCFRFLETSGRISAEMQIRLRAGTHALWLSDLAPRCNEWTNGVYVLQVTGPGLQASDKFVWLR